MDILQLSLSDLATRYRKRELSVSEVTEAFLARLEPGPVYRLVTAERARMQAKRADEAFARGEDSGPLQGVPLALKDLMDTKGDVTAAGSRVLAEGAPAQEDSLVAKRLDKAGAVFLGKTTMTELAFSGLGLNPHFGTPGNAFDPERLPGGSSSGSAVAVATGRATAAVGSDTGGSVRIPASYNGLVGLKTTDGSLPLDGVVPLSTTLDTLGPITKTVEDSWHLWRAMADLPPEPFRPEGVEGLRVLAPTTVLHDALEPQVESAFRQACARLARGGVSVEEREVPLLAEIPALYKRHGTFASLEALALYETLLETRGQDMDARVVRRILEHKGTLANDYIRLHLARKELTRAFWRAHAGFDAVVAPTVAILPPKIADLDDDGLYVAANALVLRNTLIFNFLGVPAVSVPCGTSAEGLPIGFMIATRPRQEALALAIAQSLAQSLA